MRRARSTAAFFFAFRRADIQIRLENIEDSARTARPSLPFNRLGYANLARSPLDTLNSSVSFSIWPRHSHVVNFACAAAPFAYN
jgi:hypothetical protein